jgi:hypothetical protein
MREPNQHLSVALNSLVKFVVGFGSIIDVDVTILLSKAFSGLPEFWFDAAVTNEGRAYADASLAAADLSQIHRPGS